MEHYLSQAELSLLLGVSHYTVIALEKGASKVNVSTMFEAAIAISIPLLTDNQHTLARLATIVANLTSILSERSLRKKSACGHDF